MPNPNFQPNLLCSQFDSCQHLLGVESEVALHHPAIVAWVTLEHLANGDALLFAKVEHLYALVVVHDAASEVYIARV